MIEFDNTAIVVTARMVSQTLPGAPMLDVNGSPLVLRALEQAERANLGKVYVAAAEPRVAEAIRDAGGDALASPPLVSAASDQAAAIIALRDEPRQYTQVIVLPCQLAAIDTLSLRRCLAGLMNKDVDVATIAFQAASASPGQIEVVAPLSADREVAYARDLTKVNGHGAVLKHIPLYAWRRAALEKFAVLKPTLRERVEGIELLRAIEGGLRVAVVKVDIDPITVDTPEALEAFRHHLKA